MRKGSKMTDEHKKNLSKNHADVSGKNNPFYGKKHDAAIIKKLSATMSGRKASTTTKKKMSETRMGENNPNYKHGKCQTKEYKDYHRAKRRAAKLNQTPDNANMDIISFYYEVSATLLDYEVDHIKPLSKGGLHHESNLQILEKSLNRQKKDKWPLTEEEEIKYKGLRI